MDALPDGDLRDPFEHRLDDLLARLCSDWQPPGLPDENDLPATFVAYVRLNAKRMQVAARLREQPDVASTVADQVLDAIVHDEDVSFNRQLIEPMLAVLGRRAVQGRLIVAVETGSPLQQVCAVRAWYWSQAVLVYESSEALQTRRPTEESQVEDREVADLRERYRAACLTAFVACDDAGTREWLARGFLLHTSFYPPNLHDTVARARAIAEADPVRFKGLLARTNDDTTLAVLRRPRA